eukprot:COSAG06_NODE_7017_length_2672_cov_63.497085_2_plen_56_part_00
MQGQRFRLESATARPHKLRLARRVKSLHAEAFAVPRVAARDSHRFHRSIAVLRIA